MTVPMTKPPVDHVLRFQPPWRDDEVTECGRAANDVKQVITRDTMVAKWKREGQQRAAYTTCMTCLNRAQSAWSWDENPAAIMTREFGAASFGRADEREAAIKRELLALGMLAVAHRDELATIMAGLADTSSLDERRAHHRHGLRLR